MATAMELREAMIVKFNTDVKMMQEKANEQLKKITLKHEQSILQLEDRERELRDRERKLRSCEAMNESVKREIDNDKIMNELLILEAKEAHERMLKLAEDQKSENNKLHLRIIELQKSLDDKQRLELEFKSLKGASSIFITKCMKENKDILAIMMLESYQKILKVKEEQLKGLQELNQALIMKEKLSNGELQGARNELISISEALKSEIRLKLEEGLKDNPAYAHVGVKRMGELDFKPFLAAAKRQRCSINGGTDNPIKLASLWEERLGNPCWHPFKIITIHGDSKEEILDEEDEWITSLKEECDDDIYNAVVTALKELNEYNPSCRHPLPELWNNKDKRKATLKEGVEYLLKQWKIHKQRKQVEDD